MVDFVSPREENQVMGGLYPFFAPEQYARVDDPG